MSKVSFTDAQISNFVDILVGRIVQGVNDSLSTAAPAVTPSPERKLDTKTFKKSSPQTLSQPSDARSSTSAHPAPIKEGARLVIVAALRKGESCAELAKKYNVGVGSVRAIKANLTRGSYD